MRHFFKMIALSIITLATYNINHLLSYSGTLDTSLTDTIKSWDFDETYTLYPGQYLRGFIKLRKGLSLWPPNSGSASIRITEPIDGDIWLNGNPLILESDLFLGRGVHINGRGPISGSGILGYPVPEIPGYGSARIILTDGPLIVKNGNVTVIGQFDGNGNRLTVDTASGGKISPFGLFVAPIIGFVNIELTNFNDTAYSPVANSYWILDNAKVFIDQNATISLSVLDIKGTTQFIGTQQSKINLSSVWLNIFPQSELRVETGTHVIFTTQTLGVKTLCTFKDKSSILTLNNCTVDFNAGDLDQSQLTFTSGTININGQVNFSTDRVAGYALTMGDGTTVGDIDLNFGALSRLSIGDYIDLQIHPQK
jgi:hypothetical protein